MAFDQQDLAKAEQLLVNLLKRPDMESPASEERRARALQLLAALRLSLQDLEGSKTIGRQALAIWQRRANPTEAQDRRVTHLNLANALVLSEGFDEAETLGQQLLTDLGVPRADTNQFRIAAYELLAQVLVGRKAPIEELIRQRTQIVALRRGEAYHPDDVANHRLSLARSLSNLADAQMVGDELDLANASLSEAYLLIESLGLPPSDAEVVMVRARYLPLLVSREKRCEVEAVAAAILPYAEPLGQRMLSQILMQNGENYRRFGAASRAAPLWSRVTVLEYAMACPVNATRPRGTQTTCTGSPVLIDHLRAVGTSLNYEGQGRANAGYRRLYQAGEFLRTRTLAGFLLNRDASNAYATSRDIFRDQIAAAWAINDRDAKPKPVEAAWNCVTP